MAESKTTAAVAVSFLVALVVAVASVSADTCTADCYKLCDKTKVDAACTNTCDEKCRIKVAATAYAAAKPAAKKADVAGELHAQTDGAISAATTPDRAAALATSCIDVCYGRCGRAYKHDPACTGRCEGVCRAEVDSLAFAADKYARSTPDEKAAVIMAVDTQADGPDDKVQGLSAKCVTECRKFCNDPNCGALCDDGCYAKAVSVAFALATPQQKDAINRYIDDDKANKGAGAA